VTFSDPLPLIWRFCAVNHSQVQVTNRTEFLSEYWLVIGRLMKRLEGPTVNHKKVIREEMSRQIREKNEFLNFLSPAAKIIYFRKTKNRISINYDMR